MYSRQEGHKSQRCDPHDRLCICKITVLKMIRIWEYAILWSLDAGRATVLACQSFPSFFLCLLSTWASAALAYTTTVVVVDFGEKADGGGQTTTQTTTSKWNYAHLPSRPMVAPLSLFLPSITTHPSRANPCNSTTWRSAFLCLIARYRSTKYVLIQYVQTAMTSHP